MRPFLIDAHQDIAHNIQNFGRDITLPLEQIRAADKPETIRSNGTALLSAHEYRKANIKLIFATLFAAPYNNRALSLELNYKDQEEAFQLYQQQLNIYEKLLNHPSGSFSLIKTKGELEKLLTEDEPDQKTGLMLSIEGADCVRHMDDIEYFWNQGVRAIGPAWQKTRYCGGTDQPGDLTPDGIELLKKMDEVGLILDISHMDWQAIHSSFDSFSGTIIASHGNPLETSMNATRNRFLPDNILRKLIARDGVVGIIPYNNFIVQYWSLMDHKPTITIDSVVDMIDHVCQLAGDSLHVGYGSDFDGGFGSELTPDGIDSIADLVKISEALSAHGYSSEDVENIQGKNWANMLYRSLPENE